MTSYSGWVGSGSGGSTAITTYTSSGTVSVTTAQLTTITSLNLPVGKFIIDSTFYGETDASNLELFDTFSFAVTTNPASAPFLNPTLYGISQAAIELFSPADPGGTPYPGTVSGAITGYPHTNNTGSNQIIYLITQNSQYNYTARGTLTATKVS